MKNVKKNFGLKLIIMCLFSMVLALCGISLLNNARIQTEGLHISEQLVTTSGESNINAYNSSTISPTEPSDVGLPTISHVHPFHTGGTIPVSDYTYEITFSDWFKPMYDVPVITITGTFPEKVEVNIINTFWKPDWTEYWYWEIKNLPTGELDWRGNPKYAEYYVPTGPKDYISLYNNTPSPGQKITIRSYTAPTISAWEGTVKQSTLSVYAESGSSSAATTHKEKFGTWKTMSVDTVQKNSQAGDNDKIVDITRSNSEGTDGTAITKEGYYLKDWQVKGSLSGETSFDEDTNKYYFGDKDGALAAVWEQRQYLLIFEDQYGREVGSRKTLTYKQRVGSLPTVSQVTGYSGMFYYWGDKSSPVSSSDEYQHYDKAVVTAKWKLTANTYKISWDANGGKFSDGVSTKKIDTTFNQLYNFPTTNPIRPGYTFAGWYSSPTGGDRVMANQTKMDDVNDTTIYARWEVKKDLSVNITSNESILGFNLKINETIGNSLQTTNLTNIKSHSCVTVGDSKFVFSNIIVDAASRFDKFIVTDPATGKNAVLDQDYALTENNGTYTLTVYKSIKIELVTRILVEVRAVSNFKGVYELNDIGGKIQVGDQEFNAEIDVGVDFNATIKLNAQVANKNVEFLGWYSSYTGNFEDTKFSTSISWTTPNITQSQTIYAIFKFTHYTINVYTYSDDKNFEFKQSDSDLGSNDIDSNGGKISLQFKYNNQIIESDDTSDANASISVPLGYEYQLTAIENRFSDTGYKFFGLYTDFNAMKADLDNNQATMPLAAATLVPDKKLAQSGNVINYYAKFVKEYAFTVQAGEGITNVGLGGSTNAKSVTKYYYYGQDVERIYCTILETSYQASTSTWEIIKGKNGLNEAQLNALNAQNITSGVIAMPAEPVTIKANAEARFFDLVVYAVFQESGQYNLSTQGGKGYIESLNSNEVKFDANNGMMIGSSNKATAKVKYNSSAAVLKISVNEYQGSNAKYLFSGWYSDFSNNQVSNKLNVDANGSYVIKNFAAGATYYCVFEAAKILQIVGDERVENIESDDLTFEKSTNQETGTCLFRAFVTYNKSVNFEIKLSRGTIKQITQTQLEGRVNLTYNETKTIVELTMPNHIVSLQITTEPGKLYALTIKAVVIDNLQAYYDDQEGFDKNAGYVAVNEVDTVGTTLQFHAEEASLRTLTATANNGYSFFGWYKLKTDVSYTKLVKEGTPSYRSNVDSWLNIYNPDSNPTGAYTFFSEKAEVTTDPIERIDKNLYIAVFVKNYNLTLIMGDAGIKDITYDANSGYDRNNDGILDSANEVAEKIASLQIITAPYGTNFEVFTSIMDKYTFMHFEILSGETSLGHYDLSSGKILASDVNPSENYRLEFFLYDNIQIVARTVTEYRQLTVNIFTLDIQGNPVLSMEGGTFDIATQQGEVFDIVIGAALAGFVRVNKGFVFKGFKVGEDLYPNFTMPDEDATVDVMFDRNAYILETHIVTIDEDGFKNYDDDTGGKVETSHSILYGDTAKLSLTATIGYVLKGIYVDEATKTLVDNFQQQKEQTEKLENFIFSYYYQTNPLAVVPEKPTTPAFVLYIVYELRTFDILQENTKTELNKNISTPLDVFEYTVYDANNDAKVEKGYYGEIVKINLQPNTENRYFYSYSLLVTNVETGENVDLSLVRGGVAVNASNSAFGCLESGFTYYFVMPMAEIKIDFDVTYYEMEIVFDAKTNTGTFVNSYSVPDQDRNIKARVYYNFDNYKTINPDAISTNLFASNVPYATKQGFIQISYNTKPDGSGVEFIRYEYDSEDVLTGVVVSDFVFDPHLTSFNHSTTLYAIYDYANIDLQLSYIQGSEIVYNGKFQDILELKILNFNNEIPYIYSWYQDNIFIGKCVYDPITQTTQVLDKNNVLEPNDFVLYTQISNGKLLNKIKIRSLNQDGEYRCLVEIDGGKLYSHQAVTAEEIKEIVLKPLPLGIFLNTDGDFFYGETILEVAYRNTSGILNDMHEITDSYMVLKNVRTYNDNNRPEVVEVNVKLKDSNPETFEQDGQEIINNYELYFINSCQILDVANIVTVNASVYLRTIDGMLVEHLNPDRETDIIVYDMQYTHFIKDSKRIAYGITSANINDEQSNFGDYIYVTFDFVYGLNLYKVYVSGQEITDYKTDLTTISFPLSYDYVLNNKIDIKVYLTSDCLVTAHFNVDGKTQKFKQVYNEEFKPPQAPKREGFYLEGWYFDEEFNRKVGSTWQKTGEQNIYARWQMEKISASIILSDGGVIQEIKDGKYERTYNAKAISLTYALSYDKFESSVKWFKTVDNISWQEISSVNNIVNVQQSGIYSMEITITSANETQIIYVNDVSIEVIINPYELSLSNISLDKNYDGSADLLNTVEIQGLTGVLNARGNYQTKDVSLDGDGNVQDIRITNFSLLDSNNELAGNYQVIGVVKGKIYPIALNLSVAASKIYDGNIYRGSFSTYSSISELVRYDILTIGSDAKKYGKNELSCQITFVASSQDNYIIEISDISLVEIHKAALHFEFENKTVYYNAQTQKIEAYFQGQVVSLDTVGVKSIIYTYNDQEVEGVQDSGTYNVKATVIAENNYLDWSKTVSLIIKKAQFSVNFTLNGTVIPAFRVFDTNTDDYNNIKVNSNLTDALLISKLALTKVVTKQGEVDPVESVKDVGIYKIEALYNTLNFEITNTPYVFYTIQAQALIVQDILAKTEFNFKYNSRDYQTQVLQEALNSKYVGKINLTIDRVTKKQQSTSYFQTQSTNNLINSGEYKVVVSFNIIEGTEGIILDPSISPSGVIEVVIEKFEIKECFNLKLEKTYDGTAMFQNASMSFNLGTSDDPINVTEYFSGTFVDKNAGDEILLKSIELNNPENYTVSLSFKQTLKGKILQKAININLVTEQNTYITALYQNPYKFSINKSNQKFVQGIISGEYLDVLVICNIVNVNQREFALSKENINDVAYLDWQNAEIINGNISNYYVDKISGGIILITATDIVVEVPQYDNVYDGEVKEIFVLFNNILCKYVSSENLFEGVYIDAPAEIRILDYIGHADAGSYSYTLELVGATYYQFASGYKSSAELSLNNRIDINFTITKAVLGETIERTYEYKDDLSSIDCVTTIQSGLKASDEIDIKINLGEFSTLSLGETTLRFTENSPALSIETQENYVNNYTFIIDVIITVEAKRLNVSASDISPLRYTGLELIPGLDLTFTDLNGNNFNNLEDNEYTIKFYKDNIETKVLEVGTYKVIIVSENFAFNNDGSFLFSKLLTQFNVNKAYLTEVNFIGDTTVVYNTSYQTPLSAQFKFNNNVISNIGYQIVYTQNGVLQPDGILNVGTYLATLTISSDTFMISEETIVSKEIKVSPYELSITAPSENEIWFSKDYGFADPELTRTFATPFNYTLTVKFKRDDGEAVGKYALKDPEIIATSDPNNIANYSVKNFSDINKGFHILSYKNKGGFTITLTQNITKVYDGTSLKEINLFNYPNAYSMVDFYGKTPDPKFYDIKAINLKFTEGEALNAGGYNFDIKATTIVSTTHNIDQIVFKIGSSQFIITKKEVTATVNEISKVYDGNNQIILDSVITGLCDIDKENVKVKGIFNDKNAQENKPVTISLIGPGSENYTLKTLESYTGSITPKLITINGDEEDFNKVYDSLDTVNMANLVVTGVIEGDSLNVTGKYDNKNVGTNKIIKFTLSSQNYTIGNQEFKGDITVRTLKFDKTKEYNKQFDGNYNANITIDHILGILGNDKLEISEAYYVDILTGVKDEEVGEKKLVVILSGLDAPNYRIDSINCEITTRILEIIYHFGDQDDYKIPFVDDGETISYDRTSQSVRYGQAVKYLGNSYNTLVTPIRKGYHFTKWTLYNTNIEFTETTNTDTIELNRLISNDWTIHLYANWDISRYKIAIVIETEDLNGNFIESSLGGSVSVYENNQKLTGSISCEYFKDYKAVITENPNFKFVELLINDELLTINLEAEFILTQDSILKATFKRELITLKIDLGQNSAGGYATDVWTKSENILLTTQRYGTTVKLPVLNDYGYDFNGYENLSLTFEPGQHYQIETNTTLIAIFSAKKVLIQVITNGGVGDEQFAYFENPPLIDKNQKLIEVTFDQPFGVLPELLKTGYVFKAFTLYNGDQELETVISTTILKHTDLTLSLYANWEKAENAFVITEKVDKQAYLDKNITSYEVYQSGLDIYFNNGVTNIYSLGSEFSSLTETVVKIKAQTRLNALYTFAYWQIEGTRLIDTLEILGSTFELINDANGITLNVTGFTWGTKYPQIEAVFTPKEYNVTINAYNTTRGNVELASGAYQDAESIKTLTGSIVEFEYTENAGYSLNKENTIAENANIAIVDNKIKLSGVQSDVSVTPVFDRNKIYFTVNQTEGIAFINYSLNQTEYKNYLTTTPLVVEDVLDLKIGVLYGYTLTFNIDQPEVNSALSTSEEENITVYNIRLTNFTQNFNVTLHTAKLMFSVNINQKIYDETTSVYHDTNLHSTSIKLVGGQQEITQAEYLARVIVSASVNQTEITAKNNQTIFAYEYEFLGWYSFKSGEMILITTQKNYESDVITNTTYYAVFKPIVYTVQFLLSGVEGSIINDENQTAATQETVLPGNTLKGKYHAKAENGYNFIGWEAKYAYTDDLQTVVNLLLPAFNPVDVGLVHSNITLSPKFEKRDISVLVQANRLDYSSLDEDTLVIVNDQSGYSLSYDNAQTRTALTIKAVSKNAYKFVNWTFGEIDESEYIILSESSEETAIIDDVTQEATNEYIVTTTLEVEFISDTITSFTVFANFDLKPVDVTVQFITEGVSAVQTAIVLDGTGVFTGNSQTFSALAKSSVVCYINIYKGFKLVEVAEETSQYYVSKENVLVNIEDETLMLSTEQQEIFGQRLKVIISGFTSSVNVQINGKGEKITLNFAVLTDYFENTYIENAYKGSVTYYGTEIKLDKSAPMDGLNPQFENCIFLGFALSKNQTDVIIDSTGKLVNDYWTTYAPEVSLYPLYKYANVRVEATVAPLSALVNPYTFEKEVFKEHTMMNMNSVAGYYFNIGQRFSLEIPQIKPEYHFYSFNYYKVNEENRIEVVEIKFDATQNYDNSDIFTIGNLREYDYSKAINFIDHSDLEDGVMYITLTCSMNIEFYAENYYTEFCQEVIGGQLVIDNLVAGLYAVYNKEITLNAIADAGYMVKEWWINDTKLDVTSNTFNYLVSKPSKIVVKFVGKEVLINFNLPQTAKNATLIGGNGEAFDGGYLRHVGDIIYLTAEAKAGYNFTSYWQHSNGSTFLGQLAYIITADDADRKIISLTPLINERILQVYLIVPDGYGKVLKNNKELTYSIFNGERKYAYNLPYFSPLELDIKPLQRYKVKNIVLEANGVVSDVTAYHNKGKLMFNSTLYNNASSLNIRITFEKMYYMSLIQEANLVIGEGSSAVLTTDFAGTGNKEDPYKITTVNDLVKLAYVINEGLTQKDFLKNSYNGITTYYEIVLNIDLSDRFWSPIGTELKPFNCTITIYYMPTNIVVDTSDPYYNYSLFDENVLEEYGGLFGYLGQNANIIFKISNYYVLIIVGCSILLLLLVVIITLVIVHKIRNKSLKKFDEDNNFLFDSE